MTTGDLRTREAVRRCHAIEGVEMSQRDDWNRRGSGFSEERRSRNEQRFRDEPGFREGPPHPGQPHFDMRERQAFDPSTSDEGDYYEPPRSRQGDRRAPYGGEDARARGYSDYPTCPGHTGSGYGRGYAVGYAGPYSEDYGRDANRGYGPREGPAHGAPGREDGSRPYGAGLPVGAAHDYRNHRRGGGGYDAQSGYRSNSGEPDYGGYGLAPGRPGHRYDEFEPDYHQWRNEQLRLLDEDYLKFREERFRRFADEFNEWRDRGVPSAACGPTDRAPSRWPAERADERGGERAAGYGRPSRRWDEDER